MTVATMTLGHADAGRRLTWDEFSTAEWEGGNLYDLIDGRLVVTSFPTPYESVIWQWLYTELHLYRKKGPTWIGLMTPRARVLIPGRKGDTAIGPGLAVYRERNAKLKDLDRLTWRDINPFLVCDIVMPDSIDKDLFRNVELYGAVPLIREYWIANPLDGLDQTTLWVYRRRGQKWQKPIDIGPGEVYTTKLLPDFCLRIEPIA